MCSVESGERKAVLTHVGFKYNNVHKDTNVNPYDMVGVKAVLVTQHIINSLVL
jgi:hypothetical protein